MLGSHRTVAAARMGVEGDRREGWRGEGMAWEPVRARPMASGSVAEDDVGDLALADEDA